MSSRRSATSEDVSVEQSFDGLDMSRDDLLNGYSRESLEDTRTSPQDDVGALTRIVVSDPSRPQQSQHASFLYLALIEARCKQQAVVFINSQRSQEDQLPEDHPEVCALAANVFTQSKRELANVGMLPEELVGRHIAELPSYLTSFDAAISNIAARRASNTPGLPHTSFVDSQSLPLVPGAFQLQQPQGYSTALVRRDDKMAPLQHGEQSLFSSSLLISNSDVSRSNYKSEYQQISKLGSGGFGSVFLVKHGLDNHNYAITRIAVPAEKFGGDTGQVKLQKVLAEVQSLAQLQHDHIVRYHHSWLEERDRSKDKAGDEADSEEGFGSDSNDPTESLDAVTKSVRSMQLGSERNFLKEFDRQRAKSSADEKSGSYICFVIKQLDDMLMGSSETSSSPKPVSGYKSASREPGEPDSEDEDDTNRGNASTEEISRAINPGELTLYKGIKKDMVLHIKMAAYPLSLEDFIWHVKRAEHPLIKHCFHALPTIRLLLAILDGTEFLHRKGFIHRDLKPPNIFLSILEPNEPPPHQFINILDCKECGTPEKATYICPHIGDFGLVHDLKVVTADSSATPSKKAVALQPFPFSTAATQQAGTKLYYPTTVPKENPICPKLDVYGFGIIAFEMVYKFDTKTERVFTMDKMRVGVFPDHFEQHTLFEGIKAMLCQDRDERWSCAQVREWLLRKLKEETER